MGDSALGIQIVVWSWIFRILIGLLTAALIAVSISLGTVLLHALREHQVLQRRLMEAQERLVSVRETREVRKEYLDLLVSDAEFLGRIVRQRLGYVSSEEKVFRFEPRD